VLLTVITLPTLVYYTTGMANLKILVQTSSDSLSGQSETYYDQLGSLHVMCPYVYQIWTKTELGKELSVYQNEHKTSKKIFLVVAETFHAPRRTDTAKVRITVR